MLTIKCSEVLCGFCYTLSNYNVMKTYFSVQCCPIWNISSKVSRLLRALPLMRLVWRWRWV